MGRFAVLVDAGYLLSQGVQILSEQRSKSRKDIAIADPRGLITQIISQAVAALGNSDLLRVYWYDGVAGRLSAEHEALSLLPDVQFRAGTISKSGLQKGVDSKIMADLIELSTNQAITDAVLLTGDGDLVIGVDLAQRRGVRVAILGLEDLAQDISHNQSFEIVCAADRVRRLARADIAPFLSYHPSTARGADLISPTPAAPAKKAAAKKAATKKVAPAAKKSKAQALPPATAMTDKPHLDELPVIVQKIIAAANPPFDKATVPSSGTLSQAIDSRLLKAATEILGRKPMPSERTALRRLFQQSLAR